MASPEDHLTITFDLIDVEALMGALLCASWYRRDPEDRASADRLYKMVVAKAGPEFWGAALRTKNVDGPRGTNPEEGR